MLWTIFQHISTLIGGMRVVDGYNFDWGDVNVYENQEKYPSAKVTYLEELNLDESENRGGAGQQYFNSVIFNIKCEFKDEDIEPVNSIEQTTKLDRDLKKLFGINHAFDTVKGGYAYYMGHTPVFQHNEEIPCGVNWQLKVKYYQSRINPSVHVGA